MFFWTQAAGLVWAWSEVGDAGGQAAERKEAPGLGLAVQHGPSCPHWGAQGRTRTDVEL